MELLLLVLSMALLPVYSFASGGVQFSHMVLALFMAVRLLRSPWRLQGAELTLVALLGFIILRAGFGVMSEDAPLTSLFDVLYVAFAFLILLTFSRLPLDRPAYRRAVHIGLGLAVATALLGIWLYGATWTVEEGSLTRSVGTFNNPNQLAYFAVCLLSLASLLYLRHEIHRPAYIAFLASAIILATAAVSKAGLLAVGAGALVAVAALLNRDRLSGKLIVLCGIVLFVLIQLYLMGLLNDFYFIRRLQHIGADSDDNLAARGYLIPQGYETGRILFGLGQQGVSRMLGHEVHSTFWSFFAKYGLVGFLLFMLFWWQWTRRIWSELGLLGVVLVVIPPTLFGITHNGSRFAIFWLLIGISFAAAKAARPAAAAAPVQPQMQTMPWPARRFG